MAEDPKTSTEVRCATYARVSSSQNKDNAFSQSERLQQFATAKGYTLIKNVVEIGSGLNDERPKLTALLKDKSWNILLVEHKDRLTRFGFRYLDLVAESQNRKIEVINLTDNQHDADLVEDLVSIITSFCARIYGRRRSQRKTEKIIKELNSESS